MTDTEKRASLDDQNSSQWRTTSISEANGFVVRDYTASVEPVVMVIPTSELMAVVQDIVANHRKAAIYAIGERICDFS